MNTKSTWGSHVPINKSILETFDITGVIELGAGYNSTQMFFENNSKVLSIETSKEWVNEIRKNIKEDENHRILYYDIPSNIIKSTRRHQVTKEFLTQAVQFVDSQITSEFNFLFIDSISCLRYDMLVNLYHKFDVITFHDYQKPGIKNHYNDGYINEDDDYQMYIDQTYEAHTGILIKKTLTDKIDQLMSNLQRNTFDYIKGSEAKLIEVENGNM